VGKSFNHLSFLLYIYIYTTRISLYFYFFFNKVVTARMCTNQPVHQSMMSRYTSAACIILDIFEYCCCTSSKKSALRSRNLDPCFSSLKSLNEQHYSDVILLICLLSHWCHRRSFLELCKEVFFTIINIHKIMLFF
jgi:hypothetical protein